MTAPEHPPRESARKVNTDLVGGVLLLLVGAVGLLQASGGTFQIWIFPRVLSGLLIAMGAGLVVKGVIAPDRRVVVDRRTAVRTILPAALGLIVYYLLLPRLGFLATTFLMYGGATLALRERPGPRATLTAFGLAAVVAIVLYLLFSEVFYVPLPDGSWLEALGLV